MRRPNPWVIADAGNTGGKTRVMRDGLWSGQPKGDLGPQLVSLFDADAIKSAHPERAAALNEVAITDLATGG